MAQRCVTCGTPNGRAPQTPVGTPLPPPLVRVPSDPRLAKSPNATLTETKEGITSMTKEMMDCMCSVAWPKDVRQGVLDIWHNQVISLSSSSRTCR
jgi:hypothetical protein